MRSLCSMAVTRARRAFAPFAVRGGLRAWLAAGALVMALAAGCSSKASLVPAGGECELATDCAEGLVCIPQKDGARKCDSDLSSVEKPAGSGGADAAAPPAPAADGGAAPDGETPADATTPPTPRADASPPPSPDASVRDASPPPVADASDGAAPGD